MRTRIPTGVVGFAFLAAVLGLGACQGYVADAGGASERPTWDTTETCGDGQDNDGDGVADEGCGCTRGETQACFTGHPTQRGVGACHDGVQTCEASDEFTAWGDCVDVALPTGDSLGDGVDQDCSGEDGPADECLPSEYGEGCFNGHDEDCDGLEDCEDPDCAAKCEEGPGGGGSGGGGTGTGGGGGGGGGGSTCPATGPTPEECGNGIDDDCDGTTDCEDYNCIGRGSCDACVPESCTNDIDDDCDGREDCDDADCNTSADCNGRGDGGGGEGGPGGDNGLPPNPPGTGGGGGGGGSGDGSDCEEECVPGNFRWCDSPIQCRWAKQQCNPDGSWGTCVETGDKAPGCSSVFYDTICCLAADNQCCQDYPGYGSIGECDTQVVRTCR